jgi:hypothetical protein
MKHLGQYSTPSKLHTTHKILYDRAFTRAKGNLKQSVLETGHSSGGVCLSAGSPASKITFKSMHG